MAKQNKIEKELETEWTYILEVSELESKPLQLSIAAEENERKALAERLSLVEVSAISADIRVKREQGGRVVHVSGRFSADIVQNCVVSLEPVNSHLEDDFEAWFAEADSAVSINKAKHDLMRQKGQAELPVLDEQDDPEEIIDGKINLGEVVTQFMSLAIDPFPHADGAEFETGDDKSTLNERSDLVRNPFEKLKQWKELHNKKED